MDCISVTAAKASVWVSTAPIVAACSYSASCSAATHAAPKLTAAAPARNEFDARLAALGRMQDLLFSNCGGPVALADLATAELAALGHGAAGRVLVRGPRVELPADKVLPIALALNELSVNALKHGAIAQLSGFLAVRWRVEGADGESRLVFELHESGADMPSDEPV